MTDESIRLDSEALARDVAVLVAYGLLNRKPQQELLEITMAATDVALLVQGGDEDAVSTLQAASQWIMSRAAEIEARGDVIPTAAVTSDELARAICLLLVGALKDDPEANLADVVRTSVSAGLAAVMGETHGAAAIEAAYKGVAGVSVH